MTVVDPPQPLTRADVAAMLGVPLKTLTWWVWALSPHKRYTEFEIARPHGGDPRAIHAPIKPIKDLQRRLVALLAPSYDVPPQVHGFVVGKGPTTNARAHRRQQWVLRFDLHDFFPSIHFGRVRGMFGAYPFTYPEEVATLLAQLCCHQGQLPQGAPTSPLISNLICRGMDKQFAALARAERCYYTRYADDICFSTDRTSFPASLASIEAGSTSLGPALVEAVTDAGFSVHPEKTHLMRHTQRQRVTGLIVNRKLNVSRQYTRSLRNLLYIWQKHGEDDAKAAFARTGPHQNWPPDKPPPSFRLVIRGRVQRVGSVKGWDDPVYLALARTLSSLDEDYRPRVPAEPGLVAYIYTEGASDLLHLAAAQRYFHANNEYTNLTLVQGKDSDRGGEDALLKFCKGKSLTRQEMCCVCLFDRDGRKYREAIGNNQDWRNHGNGVVAVALVPPEDSTRICIEGLYGPDLLTRVDSANRRVYLSAEFDSDGRHIATDGRLTTPHPKSPTLVREEVFEAGRSGSVALSKMAFAKAVWAEMPPFADVDFDGFRPTFDVIGEAVHEATQDLRLASPTAQR